MKLAIRTLLMAGIYSMTLLSGQTIDSFTVKPNPNWTSGRMSDPSGMPFGNPIEIAGVPGPVQNCGAGIITNCRTSRVVTTGYATNGLGGPNYMALELGSNLGWLLVPNFGASLGYGQIDYNFTAAISVASSKKIHFDAATLLSNVPTAVTHPRVCVTATFGTRGIGATSWTKSVCQDLSGGTAGVTPVFYGFDLPVTAFLTPNQSGGYPATVFLSALQLKVSITSPNQSAVLRSFEFRP